MRRSTRLAILSLLALSLSFWAATCDRPLEAPDYQLPLNAYLGQTAPGSQVQVLQTAPLHLLVTTLGDPGQRALLELDMRSLLGEFPPDSLVVINGRPPWRPDPTLLWLAALACALPPLKELALRRRAGAPEDKGARLAAIILGSYPPEFARACLELLTPDQARAVGRAHLNKPTYAEQARILSAFKAELAHARAGVHPQAVATILGRDYLSGTPGPQPIPNYMPSGSRSRRRIYSCPSCQEVFIDRDSLELHLLTHSPSLNPRRRVGAALLLLAAVIWLWPRFSSHLTLPAARPLTPAQQAVVSECEQLCSGLLVLQARDQLVLACDPGDLPRLQAVVQQSSLGPIMLRPLAPASWRWLPTLLGGLGLLIASWRPRTRKAITPAQLCRLYGDAEKTILVITLAPALERCPPQRRKELLEEIVRTVSDLAQRGIRPILLCNPDCRPWLDHLTARRLPSLVILSWKDIAPDYIVYSVAMVDLEDSEIAAPLSTTDSE